MSFLVYKSSAGSGKTFTLVKEYLKLALGTSDPMVFSQILAITFTNKAANEMTDRILETLEEMSGVVQPMQDRTADMMKLLLADIPISEEELVKRSRKTLKKVVHNYRDFSVGTIDSFVHRIIRSFATEMGLNQQFEVELNFDGVLKRAVDLMLERVGVDKVLTKFIEEYINAKFEQGKTWKIDEDLYGFARGLQNSHEWKYLNRAKAVNLKTYASKQAELKKHVKGYENTLLKISKEATAFGLNGLTKKQYAHTGQFIGHFEKIISGKFMESIGANVKKLREDSSKKWFAPKNTDEQERDLIDSKKEQLIAYFDKIEAFRNENESEYIFNHLIYSNIYKVALLSEVDKEVQKIKEENDLVLISDFTDLVGEITRNEPVPFIYEKLGERYKHFMFDEFQDTSLMQWHNMLPLVENSLSQGGTSMVVGDAKQSIYRWRGGVAEQFSQLPNVYNPYNDPYVTEREMSLKIAFTETDTLNKNFRSKANIVKFNNLFFSEAQEVYTSIGTDYNDVEQGIKDKSSEGFVSFNFYREGLKAESTELIFEDIGKLITEIEADGYDLKDIAVLTKKKSDTPALVEHLSDQNINVISSESLLVSNSVAVKLIAATLNHLNQPNEPFFMTELLIRINEVSPKKDFHLVISKANKMNQEGFHLILQGWGMPLNRNEILALPMYEMVSAIVEVYGMNHRKDNRLAAWMDYIYNFSQKAGRGLYDLIDDWKIQESKLSIQIPEDVDAVNVMTIHKSKGLDWPIVILAEGNWRKTHGSHTIWVEVPEENPIPVALIPHNKNLEGTVFEKEYLEEEKRVILDHLNALYVAFTRPADRLYVMCIHPEKDFFSDLLSILDQFENEPNVEIETEDFKKGVRMTSFSYGVKEPKEIKEKEEVVSPNLLKIKNHKNSAYRNKLKVKKNYIKWLNNAGERDFGTLVHKAFSYIETAADIKLAITKLVVQGEITEDEKEKFENLLLTVVENPEVAPYFKPGLTVKNEAEIILANGELLRPDRVVIENNNAVVIDFKTGMRTPSHDAQILSYKIQLEKMGYINVKAVLIYTQDVQVVEVA